MPSGSDRSSGIGCTRAACPWNRSAKVQNLYKSMDYRQNESADNYSSSGMIACRIAESTSRSLLPDGPAYPVSYLVPVCAGPRGCMLSMAAPADRIDSSDEQAARTPIW
jgi:hypothetical protein